MPAHREAGRNCFVLPHSGKPRILLTLIAAIIPETHSDLHTADNATVYRIEEFDSSWITHQTPVKERHEILTRFREWRI